MARVEVFVITKTLCISFIFLTNADVILIEYLIRRL